MGAGPETSSVWWSKAGEFWRNLEFVEKADVSEGAAKCWLSPDDGSGRWKPEAYSRARSH